MKRHLLSSFLARIPSKRSTLAALTLLGSACTLQACYADELRGRVVAVIDGDTLTVLDAQKEQHRIRLAEIDAPEKKQPFGRAAKESLAGMCFQKEAVVQVLGRDRYGRTIGHVICHGVNTSEEQVRRGMAWIYPSHTGVINFKLHALLDEARAAKRGLWRDRNPVEPWKFRAWDDVKARATMNPW
ncbi:MAG: thermonuclease family protein [Gammaproteobacteria bacterium]|nr:thermonuclease family protein [Gammaproteobacteria bacterium]